MRRFLAAAGASLMLGGVGCAPLAQGAPADSVGPGSDGAVPRTVSTADGAPRILIDESFVHGWPDDQRGSAWFADDGYRLSTRQPGEFVAVRAPLADVPADVIVSGTFRKLGGPPGGGYGLILEDQGIGAGDGVDQSGQFIVAEVGDRGEIGVWRRDGERWTDLVPWTPSRAVHTDTNANDLSVQLLGGRLTFLVNGDQVADLTRVAGMGVRRGSVGIFTGGDLNEVVVNHFRVQVPGVPADQRSTPGQRLASVPIPQSGASVMPQPGQRLPSDPPGGVPALPDAQRVRDLLVGIAEDIGAIASSFEGGLDNPHDPVSDPVTLKQDAARLEAATSKANELQAEMERVRNGAPGGR